MSVHTKKNVFLIKQPKNKKKHTVRCLLGGLAALSSITVPKPDNRDAGAAPGMDIAVSNRRLLASDSHCTKSANEGSY